MDITFIGDPLDGKEILKGYKPATVYDEETGGFRDVQLPVKKLHQANNPPSITKHGIEFPLNETVVIDDQGWIKEHGHKFVGNSHFKVDWGEEPEVERGEVEGAQTPTTNPGAVIGGLGSQSDQKSATPASIEAGEIKPDTTGNESGAPGADDTEGSKGGETDPSGSGEKGSEPKAEKEPKGDGKTE